MGCTAAERARSNHVTLTWHDQEKCRGPRCFNDLGAGKPIADSLGEIAYAASFIEWYAEEGNRLYSDTIPSHLPGETMTVRQQPVGVVGAITPWNFPAAMLTRKAVAAMAAGCPVISIPSKVTPFSALALDILARDSGVPDGVFRLVTDHARELGEELEQGIKIDGPVITETLTSSAEYDEQVLFKDK